MTSKSRRDAKMPVKVKTEHLSSKKETDTAVALQLAV